jgi:hypothetical protein
VTPNAFLDDAAAVLIFSIKLGGGVDDGDGAADDAALLVLLLLAISIVLDEYILLNYYRLPSSPLQTTTHFIML